MNSGYNPVHISHFLSLLALFLSPSQLPHPPFSHPPHSPFSPRQSCCPLLSFIFVFSTLLSFHFLTTTSYPPLTPPNMFLSVSSAEVQSQGFCLLVIYFVISPPSEVHALGLSVCCGAEGPRATQIKKTQ